MFKAPVVFTTIDKSKRDELFRLLRESTDPLERQVTKFSGQEAVLDAEGKQVYYPKHYEITGHFGGAQMRAQYRSTWSVSYPSA